MNSKIKLWSSRLISFGIACGGSWLVVMYALRFPLNSNVPKIMLETQPTRIAADLASSSIFGFAPVEQVANAPVMANSNFSLLGLVANDKNQTGFALLKKEGSESSIVAKLGKEIEPGIMVTYVSKRQINVGGNVLNLPQASYSGNVVADGQVAQANRAPPSANQTYNSRINQAPSFQSRSRVNQPMHPGNPNEVPQIENFPPNNGASGPGSPL